jgi:hypothetical protein
MSLWRVVTPYGIENIEADGIVIENGGALSLMKLTGRPPSPMSSVSTERKVVKSYSPESWNTVELKDE